MEMHVGMPQTVSKPAERCHQNQWFNKWRGGPRLAQDRLIGLQRVSAAI